MRAVHFTPWIGKNYARGINGKKVMALGESHYCGKPEDDVPSITNNVICRYLDSTNNEFEGWMNTYTKFIRALSGEEISRETSSGWWNRILFYNYVQVPMTGARVAPTEQEFRDSDAAFFEILGEYQPDKILAWGKRLYSELPNKGHKGMNLIDPAGQPIETWIYPLKNGHLVEVIGINHPSAAFAWEYWYQVIQKFINR